MGRGHIKWPRCEPTRLGFAYPEYLGSAFWAHTLSRGTPVLHDDLFRTLDLNLALALHTVSLCHSFQPPLTKICAEAITYVSVRQCIGVRVGGTTDRTPCLTFGLSG